MFLRLSETTPVEGVFDGFFITASHSLSHTERATKKREFAVLVTERVASILPCSLRLFIIITMFKRMMYSLVKLYDQARVLPDLHFERHSFPYSNDTILVTTNLAKLHKKRPPQITEAGVKRLVYLANGCESQKSLTAFGDRHKPRRHRASLRCAEADCISPCDRYEKPNPS